MDKTAQTIELDVSEQCLALLKRDAQSQGLPISSILRELIESYADYRGEDLTSPKPRLYLVSNEC